MFFIERGLTGAEDPRGVPFSEAGLTQLVRPGGVLLLRNGRRFTPEEWQARDVPRESDKSKT